MSTDVDDWYANADRWHDEAARLREILEGCDLEERFKWRKPCYAHDGSNVAIVQSMKSFLALMFFKGALLDDPKGVLEEQGKNSRSARRLTFRSVADVERMAPTLRKLVKSAVAVETKGLTLPERPELELVAELQERLDADPTLKAAFEALTPGRQRGYNLHFAGAKQSKTRASRVEKLVPKILAGKGLRDR
ncbi:MAG: YdeI/OmpD-associated family protein [Deltaproteobacteria bacterium]|nr:YdeI/OmpD-associated family protein [Deltaproteobacteria bacterium]